MQQELLKRYNQKYSAADQRESTPPPVKFAVPDNYDEHVVHMRNFFDAMRGAATLNEDAVFGFRAAAPSLACNKSYFEKKIVEWDPETMTLKS
jgi:hypothetical protein